MKLQFGGIILLTNRIKISLYQLITQFTFHQIKALIQKYGDNIHLLSDYHNATEHFYDTVKEIILDFKEENIIDIITELINAKKSYRNSVSPRYLFDQRWEDLRKCLMLDGYKINSNELLKVEPDIGKLMNTEDDLKKELSKSGLNEVRKVIKLIDSSTDAYRKNPPDYNGCLANIRTSLETLGKSIAYKIQENNNEEKDVTKWGNTISYLCSKDFINENEKKALTGVYSLLSEMHRPIDLSEEEFTRFSRTLGLSMCYYLIKKHNSR